MKSKSPFGKSVFRLSLCAVIAAMAAALMMITSLIPVGTYAFPCLAGALITVIVIEFGKGWALSVYAVAAVLSFFLSGDKEAVAYFIMIFGYYPVVKNIIESKIKSKALAWLLKLLTFNAAAVLSFFAATWLLSVPAEEYTLFGVYVPYVFLILGNLFFLLYDYAVTVYIGFYVTRLRDRMFGKFR